MKKIIYFFFIFPIILQAQLNVQLILPPPSPAVMDFYNNVNLFQVVVTNTSAQPVSFIAEGEVRLEGDKVGALPKEKSKSYTVNAFSTNTYKIDDIFRIKDDIEYSDSYAMTVLRTGYFPAGNYEWCFAFYDAENPAIELVPFVCKNWFVTAYQPPVIVSPQSGAEIMESARPILRWTPITPAFRGGILNYKVQMFAIMQGQDAFTAFRVNQPIFERETPALQLMWPPEVPMEIGNYIWTVRAFDNMGNAVGNPEVFAEPATLIIKANTGVLSITGEAIRVKFSPKNNPTEVKYEMIVASKNVQAVQQLLSLSDQIGNYDYKIESEPKLNLNAKNLATLQYNAWGDVITIRTSEGNVLSFTQNPQNNAEIGWNPAGNAPLPDPRYFANGKGTRKVPSTTQTQSTQLL